MIAIGAELPQYSLLRAVTSPRSRPIAGGSSGVAPRDGSGWSTRIDERAQLANHIEGL